MTGRGAKPPGAKRGQVRIIGGTWRGRSIAVESEGLRPTSDRAREAVFNRLIHGFSEYGFRLHGAKVLDAFAGSGALGLEALSRGAAQATFLDRNRAACSLIEGNIAHLGAEDRATVLNVDATVVPRAASPFDLALLDPPYELNLMEPALAGLARQNWLKPGALVVAESEESALAVEVEGFSVIDRRAYGRAAMTFLVFGKA